MSEKNTAPDLPSDLGKELTDVLRVWGKEVSGAQSKLEQQIREATTELNQIGGLLESQLRNAAPRGSGRDADDSTVAELLQRIEELEEEVAYWKARAEKPATDFPPE